MLPHNSTLNDYKTEKDRWMQRERESRVSAVLLLNEYYTQSASIHIPKHYMNFYSLMDFSFHFKSFFFFFFRFCLSFPI